MKMNSGFDKYNSITFSEYLLKKNGYDIVFDYDKHQLKINDLTGETTAIVYLSANIDHQIQRDELLNKVVDKKTKAYYVYENGIKGHDWLWHYGDLVSLNELL